MKLTEQGKFVLEQRYLKKDDNGNIIETPEDMLWRVAKTVAEVDKDYDKNAEVEKTAENFFNLMNNGDFLPATPILANIGNPLSQGSSCFVLPIGDSIEEILDCAKETCMVMKAGGGVGISFSKLRPKDDDISTTKGKSSGVVSFISIFDKCIEVVKSGGIRRGAMLGELDCNHPEIFDFIKCKTDNKSLTNFNISVGITDNFIDAVKNDKQWNLVNPRNNEIVQSVSAKALLSTIVESAHKCGDPGLLFLDTANKLYPNSLKIQTYNPCGEIQLESYDACLLSSINLNNFIKNKKSNNFIDFFDYEKFSSVIADIVNFLDNVIDLNKFSVQKITETVKKNRRMGIGIMGFADLLLKADIPYNSNKAIEWSEKISYLLTRKAILTSEYLGEKRGVFPASKNLKENADKLHWSFENIYKRRNMTLTCAAPCGSISVLANCSSGVEPYFSLSYRRDFLVHDKQSMEITNEKVFEYLDNKCLLNYNIEKQIKETGSVQDIKEIPEHEKNVLKTATEIPWQQHVKIQAEWQKNLDAGVSKTINLPESATQEDIWGAYMLAHELGCKGITVYRNNCKTQQVLNIPTKKANSDFSYLSEPQRTKFIEKAKRLTEVGKKIAEAINKDREKIIIETLEKENMKIQGYQPIIEDDLNPEPPDGGSGVSLKKYLSTKMPSEVLPITTTNTNTNLGKYETFELPEDENNKSVIISSPIYSPPINLDEINKEFQEIITKFNKIRNKETFTLEKEVISIEPRERPKITQGKTERIRTSDGNLYVTVNNDDKGPCEVFIHIGKHGSDVTAWAEAVGRLISLCLRSGLQPNTIADELIGIISRPMLSNGGTILSVPDGIGKVLIDLTDRGTKKEKKEIKLERITDSFISPCPECGNPLISESGCKKCTKCEFSTCS